MAENKQYVVTQKGGPWAVRSVPKHNPVGDEIVVAIKAVALNPLDWKQYLFGAMIPSWPAIIGCDGAGVVEAVGPDVKSFKAGDEVFGFFLGHPTGGVFQEYPVTNEFKVGKKPASYSFEEAASLPVCYCTAAATLFDLGIALPYLEAAPKPNFEPKSVLILGGSSGVGTQAIQLLRLALPSVTILTTCSKKHHARAVELGATKAFDYSEPSLAEAIKAATPGGAGLDAIIDVVAGAQASPEVFDALRADGPKEYTQVMTGVETKVPEGVKNHVTLGAMVFKNPAAKTLMPDLTKLIDAGKYQLPIQVQVVGKGLEDIGKGVDQLKKGVSGTKLVVTL